jgi:hypothetical protein
MRIRNCVTVLATTLLLTGCIVPWPHTTIRTGVACGRVLDQQTHAPVKGATLYFSAFPRHSCRSDAAGRFHLRATHNFHFGYLFLVERADWPFERYDGFLTVDRSGYEGTGREVNRDGFRGDILLRPSPGLR